MSTNWADYLNLVYSVPFWEAIVRPADSQLTDNITSMVHSLSENDQNFVALFFCFLADPIG